VVVADQMKQAVRQELGQLGDDTATTLVGLPASRRDADDDVSKKEICAIAARSFSLSERKDIGRTIFPPV
jgi:hypothetical protein